MPISYVAVCVSDVTHSALYERILAEAKAIDDLDVIIVENARTGERMEFPQRRAPIELVAIERNEMPVGRLIFPKTDYLHWNRNRQRNLRGRQHQRLIFQRTTNK